MIVISGGLVLVALVLLVIGLIGPSLGFVYASIGASLAAFAFLVVGILQRRKVEPVTVEGAPASAAELAAVIRSPEPRAAAEAQPLADGSGISVTSAATSGTVLVVQGRPRYHVTGCRYLTGKSAQEVEVVVAREEGFTACGVCRPDATLTPVPPTAVRPTAAPLAAVAAVEEPVEEVVAETSGETAAVVPAKGRKVATSAAVPAKTPAKTAKALPAVARTATKVAQAAKQAGPVKTAAKAAPATAAVAATVTKPAAKPTAKAAAKPAAKAAAKPGVVVIPDRDKFHAPSCRYVRGAEGATEITRATATRQGYTACGVCTP